MHTITLKADDSFFTNITNTAKEYGYSKSQLIRIAVMEYIESKKAEQLREQIAKASMLTRGDSQIINQEFDQCVNDGLDNV